MQLFRLSPAIYSNDLTGSGAKLFGGRWNSKGNPVIYCSENRSLALLEYLVNIPFLLINYDLVFVIIQVPDSEKIEEVKLKDLPTDWRLSSPPLSLKKIGDDWIHNQTSLLLKVPSVISPNEHNFLINPAHKGILKVKIIEEEKLQIDKRLLRGSRKIT